MLQGARKRSAAWTLVASLILVACGRTPAAPRPEPSEAPLAPPLASSTQAQIQPPPSPKKQVAMRWEEHAMLAAAFDKEWGNVRRWIEQRGADPRASHDAGLTLLHLAAGDDQVELMEWLIKRGLDPQIRRDDDSTLLHHAAWFGKTRAIALLLAHGVPVNARDREGKSALQNAEGNRAWDAVRQLIKAGADGRELERIAKFSPLHVAVFRGNESELKELLKTTKSVEETTGLGETALMLAAAGDQPSILQILLDAKANVNAKDQYSLSVLHHAITGGNAGILDLLLRHGADPSVLGLFQESLLHDAAERGAVEQVKLLLARGLPVNATDRREETPLSLAAKNNHWEVVRELLKHKANPRVRHPVGRGHHKLDTDGGLAPITYAAQAGNLDAVRWLVDAGADPQERIPPRALGEGRSLMHEAAQSGNVTLLDFLASRGVSLLPGKSKETPLHLASWRGRTEAIRWLLKQGQRVDARNEQGDTPAMDACEGGSIEALTILVAHGAQLEQKDDSSQTLLHKAAFENKGEMCSWLLGKGLSPDATDRFGRTPLWYAAQGNHEAVDALLRVEIKLDVPDEDGLTPTVAAAQHGDWDIVEHLLRSGASPQARDRQGRAILEQVQQDKPAWASRIQAAIQAPRPREK